MIFIMLSFVIIFTYFFKNLKKVTVGKCHFVVALGLAIQSYYNIELCNKYNKQ